MPRTAQDDAPAVPVLWSLNGLRGAGALLVMLYHVNSWNLQVLRGSSAFYTGVGLFFVLSGFVLTWTTRPGVTVGAFYTRRVARILPNHLAALALGVLVTVAVVGATIDPIALLAGAFLVQAWLPDDASVFAINGVAWSLSCEIAFYAAFPALLWGLRRLRARTRAVVAVSALAVPPVLGVLWPGLITLMFHLPPARLPEFLIGMVTALAVQEGWRPRASAPVLLAVLATLILGAARFDVHPTVLTAVLALVFAPLAARCAWSDVEQRSGWARHPAVMLGGALSFSFYLVHELVIKAVVATPLRGWVTLPVVLVVSAVLALGLWRGVELPARARILAAARQPGPRLVTGRTTGSRRPAHSRPLSVAWSFPVPPVPAPGVTATAVAPATTPPPAGSPATVVLTPAPGAASDPVVAAVPPAEPASASAASASAAPPHGDPRRDGDLGALAARDDRAVHAGTGAVGELIADELIAEALGTPGAAVAPGPEAWAPQVAARPAGAWTPPRPPATRPRG
jgi:peptidoglycan/LPS O-acetylase OafA/YrhL